MLRAAACEDDYPSTLVTPEPPITVTQGFKVISIGMMQYFGGFADHGAQQTGESGARNTRFCVALALPCGATVILQ